MDWGVVPPTLTVVLAPVVALAGVMWAIIKVIRVEFIARVDTRFDAMDQRFTARLDVMDEKNAARFAAMDEKYTARFDAMDEKNTAQFEANASRFDTLEVKIDAVDKRVDGTDRRIDELRSDVRALTERFDRFIEGQPPPQFA